MLVIGSNISFNDFFLLLDGSNNLINFEIDIPVYVICVGRIKGVETKSLSYQDSDLIKN